MAVSGNSRFKFVYVKMSREDNHSVSDLHFLDLNSEEKPRPHEWRRLTECNEFVGVGRTKHTSVAYENAIYVFGGINGKMILNDLLRFDTNEMSWSRPPNSCPPSARYHHSAVVYHKSMFIFGGYTGAGQSTSQLANCNDLYEYRFSASAWFRVKLEGLKPVPRCGHGCAVYGQHLWIFAGYDGKLRLNDMWRLSLQGSQQSAWTEVSQVGDRPPTCCNFAMTVARDSMYVFSGQSGAAMGNELFRFHFDTGRWYRIVLGEYILKNAPPPPSKRFGHTMVNFERHLYVFGGGTPDSTLPAHLHAFDLDDETWSVMPVVADVNQTPSCRLFHAATVIHDSMYIFGGTIEAKLRSNELFQFRFSNFPACTLRHDLGQLYESQALCDVRFHLNPGHPSQETIIEAHIAIVAARSKIIESMIDKLHGTGQDLIFKFDGVNPKAFSVMVLYMYTDRINPAKVDIDASDCRAMVILLIEIYNLAVRFELPGLEKMCTLYFRSSINCDNVLTAMVNARGLTFIEDICMKCILKDTNYLHLVMSEEFEALPSKLMTGIVRRRELHMVKQKPGPQYLEWMRMFPGDKNEKIFHNSGGEDGDARASLEDDLQELLTRRIFCDIHLVLEEGVRVPAHRAILAARSRYFHVLFGSYPPCKNEVCIQIGAEVVPSPESIQSLLAYVYHGRTDMPTEHALYLYSASSFFDFSNNQLLMLCKRNLECNISEGNVIDILAVSHKLNLTDIKQYALGLIVKNIGRVGRQQARLNSLNHHLLVEIIHNTALQFDNLNAFMAN